MPEQAPIVTDVTKASPKLLAVEATLPEALRPVFRQLVEDYRMAAFAKTRGAYVSFDVLADLVRRGWRPLALPLVALVAWAVAS